MLYMQGKTNIIGMHPNRGNFAAELVKRARKVGDDANVRTIGVWEFVGLTGEWSRVLALYEYAGGWTDVCQQIRQIMQQPSPDLAEVYRVADSMRSGGVDDLLESLSGCPALDDLREAGHGPVLVAETARVPAGGEEAYAAELHNSFGPVASRHGLRLFGLYRHALTDDHVMSYWSADLASYRSFMASGDGRRWHAEHRDLHTSWRQELWTAAKNSRFAATL
jgi:hypothetical protein